MKKLFLLMVFLAVSIQVDAAKMSSYTNNTTPNGDVYFVGVDPNDISQTANGSNYRYSLNSILNLGLLDAVFNSLSVTGAGDSWLELWNNTSFTDVLTGKGGYGLLNWLPYAILNGEQKRLALFEELGSFAFDTFPTYEDSPHSSGIAVNGTTLAVYSETASKWLTVALTDSLNPTPTTPTLTSLTIPAAGTTAEGVFSETMAIGAGGAGGWTLNNPTVAMTRTGGTGTVGDPVIFSLARTVLSTATENPTVSYTQPGNGFESFDDGVDLASITNASVTNNSTQTGDLLSDTWEGVAGWSVYNEESACTINQENTSTPIVGLKSLTISSPGYQEGYVYKALSSSAENVSISFNYVPIAHPSNTANLLYIFNNSTIIARIQQRVDGTLSVVDGAESAYSSTPLVSGTTYKIWVDRVKGTGANGQLKVYVAAGTSPSKPIEADGSVTTGTSTLAVSGIGFGTMNAGSIKIDNVLVE